MPTDANHWLRTRGIGDDGDDEAARIKVYQELRRIAGRKLRRERDDHTLEPTALVHEVFLKLAEPLDRADIRSRDHLLALCANAMGMILSDYARRRRTAKRGGDAGRVTMSHVGDVEPRSIDLLALDESLERLKKLDARHARIVELRFFAGCTVDEVARQLDCSRSTVEADWRAIRAWLYRDLKDRADG